MMLTTYHPAPNADSNTTCDVGDECPHFVLDSQLGTISIREFIDGKWCFIVTFNKCFDPVGTTDIGMLAKMIDEFESRNCVVICIGNDSVANYRRWVRDIEEIQVVKVNIPMLSDPDGSVLRMLGCAKSFIKGDSQVVSNGLFLIDIDKRFRASMRYSTAVGRNFYEIVRLYDALQLVTNHRVVTPANWCSGQEVMVNPQADEAELQNYRYAAIKPWFKLTNAPDM